MWPHSSDDDSFFPWWWSLSSSSLLLRWTLPIISFVSWCSSHDVRLMMILPLLPMMIESHCPWWTLCLMKPNSPFDGWSLILPNVDPLLPLPWWSHLRVPWWTLWYVDPSPSYPSCTYQAYFHWWELDDCPVSYKILIVSWSPDDGLLCLQDLRLTL
jgi:hypothetical protein